MILRKMMVAAAIVATTATAAVFANESKITQGFKSYDAMGCMLLRECKEDVDEVFSLLDISNEYPNTEAFTSYSTEFNMMLMTLNQIGVNVYLADSKYFPINHRGVYHTVTNNFYLNRDHMGDPGTLMMLMRHEGWHAAQDCMAGTIDNSMIAIILPEDSVPMLWRTLAERTYPSNAVPWEAEAQWAGRTEDMTMKALQSCANKSMWTDYEPTPMTGEWLRNNGYID
jgi:hypothetical protein|tara:strand:- start:4109 stop:4789 length:681 start_codon:yes stop_codon:yes gene_type:complete